MTTKPTVPDFLTTATRNKKLEKYAKTPFLLNGKPGDKVLIIADTKTEEAVWRHLAHAGVEQGCNVTVAMMTPTDRHHAEPTEAIATAMKSSDWYICLTSNLLYFSNASSEAVTKYDVGCLSMEDQTAESLTTGGSTLTMEELDKLKVTGDRILAYWRKGTKVHVTTPAGTDMRATIYDGGPDKTPRRLSWNIYGKIAPVWGGKRGGMSTYPSGECGTYSLPGTGEGKMVVDVSIHHPYGLMKTPIEVYCEKGLVTAIRGGKEAKQLKDYIAKYGDEATRNFPAEVSIGLNPKIKLTGKVGLDKNARGTGHMAMGTAGGVIQAALHLDGVYKNPTVTIDDTLIVDDGKVVV